jgi:hypothetical protein
MTTQQKRRFLFGDIVWVSLMFVGLSIFFLFAGARVIIAMGVFVFFAAVLTVFYMICGISIATSKIRYRKRQADLTQRN